MSNSRHGPGILSRAAGLKRFQIGRSIPCRRCKYDLRGLDLLGRCPECGTDVEQSIEAYLPERADQAASERLSVAFRIIASGWAFNIVFLVGCLLMPLAIFASGIGAIARLLARTQLDAVDEVIPGGGPTRGQLGAIFSALVLAINCGLLANFILGANYASVLLTLYAIALGVEGFHWISWLSACAERMECPIIGPVGNIARWCWALLLPAAIATAVSAVMSSSGASPVTFTISTVIVVLAVTVCSTVTMLVTNAFADAIPQLQLISELDEATLVAARSMSTPEPNLKDEPPLDIATAAGEVIQVPEPTPPLSTKPAPEPPEDDDEPDTPMGVY